MAQTPEQKAAAAEAKAKKAVIADLETAGITDFDAELDSEALKALLPEEAPDPSEALAPVAGMDKKAYAALIETYKKQNPAKYLLKKKELDAKLASFGK